MGDKEPEVTSECLGALLKLDPGEALPFVAEFLQSADEAVREGAVLALGESRRPEAFQILKDFWHVQIGDGLRETILVAMALLRLPAANDFLLSLVADESAVVATAAVSALAVHRHDTRLRERVAAAVATTGDADLLAHFEKRFRISE
jgi:HEAT repeat protein